MPDRLKSAYELAMERLRQKDAERGEKPARLGKKEKEEIAEVRRLYQAKIAEREIRYQTDRRKAIASAAPDTLAETVQKIEEAWKRDRERLEQERDAKIEAVHRRARRPGG